MTSSVYWQHTEVLVLSSLYIVFRIMKPGEKPNKCTQVHLCSFSSYFFFSQSFGLHYSGWVNNFKPSYKCTASPKQSCAQLSKHLSSATSTVNVSAYWYKWSKGLMEGLMKLLVDRLWRWGSCQPLKVEQGYKYITTHKHYPLNTWNTRYLMTVIL